MTLLSIEIKWDDADEKRKEETISLWSVKQGVLPISRHLCILSMLDRRGIQSSSDCRGPYYPSDRHSFSFTFLPSFQFLKLLLYLREKTPYSIDDMLSGTVYDPDRMRSTYRRRIERFEASLLQLFEDLDSLFRFAFFFPS